MKPRLAGRTASPLGFAIKMFAPIATSGFPDAVEGEDFPAENPLETGFINLGNASGPVGCSTWRDESLGPSYGDGLRYEHEETRTMAKVKSKRDY